MLSFAQFLLEVLRAPLPWKWGRNGNEPHTYMANFRVGWMTYEVFFSNYVSNDSTRWSVNFGPDDTTINIIANKRGVEFDDVDPYDTLRLGAGDSLKVFSTVIAIIQAFVEREHATVIRFQRTDNNRGRQNMYNRFVVQVGQALPGWKGINIGYGEYALWSPDVPNYDPHEEL